jgi:hypothetical protein
LNSIVKFLLRKFDFIFKPSILQSEPEYVQILRHTHQDIFCNSNNL